MVEVIGKGGISVRVIADSISELGKRITTFELEYHRYIHSEMMTHRLFSRNAASSRAIPQSKMGLQLEATPIAWQKNQSGMQAMNDEVDDIEGCQDEWETARLHARMVADRLNVLGLHKQWTNRLTEPFQMIKVLVTATEFDNFFWLRNDAAAQPEIVELARRMKEAYEQSKPRRLHDNEWHLPYIDIEQGCCEATQYFITDDLGQKQYLTIDQAKKVSVARCAAVSYRNTDYGLEKSEQVWDRLLNSGKLHSSSFEHPAAPMTETTTFETEGVTALHKQLGLMSGNLSGWIQLRQLLPNHTKWTTELEA